MIAGIGMDLLEISRVEELLGQPGGGRFAERVLTERERGLAGNRGKRKAEFVAGRFAAKEAVGKAFGCGIGRGLGFQDIEVLPSESGRPVCTVSGEALKRLGLDPKTLRIHLSITHSDTMAAAYAIVEISE